MLKTIFSPIKIGNMEVKNRLVVPAMVMQMCNLDSTATERYIAFHEAKARGGWGLIITENYAVDPLGKSFPFIPGLWDDSQIESHSHLTGRVHKHGAKIVAQIFHAGRQTSSQLIGTAPLAPSPVPCAYVQELPHELTREEIHDIVEKFGDCAVRAKKAGFDGVEVHGAHGYLIAEFLSPYSNKRTDEYGGDVFGRTRFAREIIHNIKAKVGDDFPMLFRISADEFVPGGRTVADTACIAMLLEEAGVHALHVSVSVYGSLFTMAPPPAVPHAWITGMAEEIKKVVSIPVITVNRITDPLLAETTLVAGKADLVAIGRGSIADPDLPRKAQAGQFDDIIYCIGCRQGCQGRIVQNTFGTCMLNPMTGRECEWKVEAADKPGKVLVAGGGPGGAEAAIVAARRGHKVKLYEKSDRLGGQFWIASIPPAKGDIAGFIAWQRRQLEKLGVEVHLNSELTSALVEQEKPDAVIVATGSKPVMPGIKGIERANVACAIDVLAGKVFVGPRVVVIGGGQVGAETAHHLCNHGKVVTIVEAMDGIAVDEEPAVRFHMMEDLAKKQVQMFVNAPVVEINNEGVVAEVNGQRQVFATDSVVIACGMESVNDLAASLEGKVDRVITIGDAVKVRKAMEAIEEGYKAGMEV